MWLAIPKTVIKTNISNFKQNCSIVFEFFLVSNNIILTKKQLKNEVFEAFESKIMFFYFLNKVILYDGPSPP